MTILGGTVPCSPVEIYGHFRELIALLIEVVSISETSVNFYETAQRNVPENYHIHTRGSENVKSHVLKRFITYC
jgi:hypothetical protein